ncbi:reverse transcriptase domain-containing protein [Tanacetum coccineum]
MYSYVIRLNFDAPDNIMDYEALLVGLVASAGKGMKELHVFIDSKILVDQVEGSRTPVTEEAREYKKEIMDAAALFHSWNSSIKKYWWESKQDHQSRWEATTKREKQQARPEEESQQSPPSEQTAPMNNNVVERTYTNE